MATVNVVLDSRQKKDQTFAIKIRITEGNQSRYKAIGFSVKKDQFREGLSNWVVKHPDALYINSLIEDKRTSIVSKITKLELENKALDFDYLLSDSKAYGHTIGDILKIIADRHFAEEAITPAYRQISLNNQLQKCFGKDMMLSEIGIQEVRKIEQYFRIEEGNIGNTVSRKIRFLRAAFKEAQLTWGIKEVNPFDLIKVKKGGKPGRIKLNKEQIDAMEALPLIGNMDVARDVFLFCYYAQGMRFGDAVRLTKENIRGGEIHYTMGKSEKVMIVFIHPKLNRLIDKYYNSTLPYLLPVLKGKCQTKTQIHYAKDDANSIINTCLQKIGIMIGVEKLTTHVARHSYAQLLKSARIDPWTAKESLGHSKVTTTEGYMSDLGNEEISKAVTGLY